MKALLRDILITAAGVIIIFLVTQNTIQISVIHGSSMEPQLQDGQRLIVNKVVYNFHPPERGDIIVFHLTSSPDTAPYIKRIIGLPGETVEIKQGTVYIHEDGKVLPLDEPYIETPAINPFEGDPIPNEEYFVLGDNRNNSDDSRKRWTVLHKNIIGKAWLSIWPPQKWGLAPNYSLNEQIAESAP